jgi:hypothetical protein
MTTVRSMSSVTSARWLMPRQGTGVGTVATRLAPVPAPLAEVNV